MVYRYNIDVEHPGGADLSFVVFRDRALLPNETVRDFGRDRSYVIVSVAETTSHDRWIPAFSTDRPSPARPTSEERPTFP